MYTVRLTTYTNSYVSCFNQLNCHALYIILLLKYKSDAQQKVCGNEKKTHRHAHVTIQQRLHPISLSKENVR